MCDLDFDGERADVWDETAAVMSTATFKGRPHECSCCGQNIGRGDPYLRHKSLSEGDWVHERLCFACWWSREVFAEAHDGWVPPPGAFTELLSNCIVENDDRTDPWRAHLAAIYRRRRMTRLGRAMAARAREYQRRRRARTSWALGRGGFPREARAA